MAITLTPIRRSPQHATKVWITFTDALEQHQFISRLTARIGCSVFNQASRYIGLTLKSDYVFKVWKVVGSPRSNYDAGITDEQSEQPAKGVVLDDLAAI